MFPNLPRNQVQLISFLLFHTGALVLVLGGWDHELVRSVGISLMAGSIWFVMMSESILLTKVQNEMHRALEELNRKRENEIQDLLYFLRESKIAADPLSSMEAAQCFARKIQFPAMTMTKDFTIGVANKLMTNILGYKEGELNDCAGHKINDGFLMSTVSEFHGKLPEKDQKAVHSKYLYLHKSGERITRTMAAHQIDEGGFFIVFHPGADDIISDVGQFSKKNSTPIEREIVLPPGGEK